MGEDRQTIKKKELEAIAQAAAKNIKTEADLNEFRQMLTKMTVETALTAELDDHLGFDKHEQSDTHNSRNGYTSKTLQTQEGQFELDTPRDRADSFEPQLVKKHQRRFTVMTHRITAHGIVAATAEGITLMQEPEIKRWTAKRKAELIKQIYRGQTTVPEAAWEYDPTQAEIESWMDDAEAGMENALKANPKDIAEQYEKQLSELKEAYGEAMLELKFRKKLQRHLDSTEES